LKFYVIIKTFNQHHVLIILTGQVRIFIIYYSRGVIINLIIDRLSNILLKFIKFFLHIKCCVDVIRETTLVAVHGHIMFRVFLDVIVRCIGQSLLRQGS
jgi:hypothetical protein